MSTVSLDVSNSIKACITTVMGAEYKEMAYSNDIALNSFRNCMTQFAVQANSVTEISSVTKFLTFSHEFTVVLTKGYCGGDLTDEESVTTSFELRQKMLELYVHLINTKAGLPSRVINVVDLVMETPEYLFDEKVTVLRGTFNIIYRLTLI
jgi:hypothetical protein